MVRWSWQSCITSHMQGLRALGFGQNRIQWLPSADAKPPGTVRARPARRVHFALTDHAHTYAHRFSA